MICWKRLWFLLAEIKKMNNYQTLSWNLLNGAHSVLHFYLHQYTRWLFVAPPTTLPCITSFHMYPLAKILVSARSSSVHSWILSSIVCLAFAYFPCNCSSRESVWQLNLFQAFTFEGVMVQWLACYTAGWWS